MRDYVIVTDPCCDIEPGMLSEWGVRHMAIPLKKGDEEMLYTLGWSAFSSKEFYDMMRAGERFKSSQVTVEAFCELFKEIAESGKDILYLSTSTGLSGCLNSAVLARGMIAKDFPDTEIVCVDTLRGSMGQGLIVKYAANLKAQGKTIQEVAEWVEKNRLNFHQVGSVDDLKYLKRAGRVTGFAAFMSGLLNIKPVIIANTKGENESVAKLRGRKTSIKVCVRFVKKHIIDPENQTVFVVNADCAEEAEEIKKQLIEDVGCKDVVIGTVGPIIGASVGPGMFGIYFFGDEVTTETGKTVNAEE